MSLVVVDSTVLIEHIDRGRLHLDRLVNEGYLVLMHEMVLGELCCGCLRDRRRLMAAMEELPRAVTVPPQVVRDFVEQHALYGTGLQWVDVNLLCSAIYHRAALYTLDKRLAKAARRFLTA